MKLTPRERRVALLLAQGYGPREIGRRMGITDSAIFGFASRMCSRICKDEQRDGRTPARIVASWAAMNFHTLQELVQAERNAVWTTLPDAVTEARIGIA